MAEEEPLDCPDIINPLVVEPDGLPEKHKATFNSFKTLILELVKIPMTGAQLSGILTRLIRAREIAYRAIDGTNRINESTAS